jgi:hypothetical protein
MARGILRGIQTLTAVSIGRVAAGGMFVTTLWAGQPQVAFAQGQAMPTEKANLPPAPSFDLKNAPIKHPTGELSVFGLRKMMSKYMEKDVQVKAFIREIYVCPEEQRLCNEKAAAPKKKGLPGKPVREPLAEGECRPCDQPHFFISDTPDMKLSRALLVADYPVKDWKTSKPRPFDEKLAKAGDTVVVTGTVGINSITGFAASNGLIIHKRTQAADGKVLLEGNAVLPPETQTIELEGKPAEKLLQDVVAQ